MVGSDNLEKINFSQNSNLKTIGRNAFFACKKLTSIELPEGVTSIGVQVFDACTSLKTLTIPGTVETIPSYSFASCHELNSVIIGNGVKNVDYCVFIDCYNLSEITIPGTVTNLDGIFILDYEQTQYNLIIYYDGTKNEFKNISPNFPCIGGDIRIICSNGTLKPLIEGNFSKGYEEID